MLQGLDGPAPVLELPDGTQLTGRFEETLGTQMVFSGPPRCASSSSTAMCSLFPGMRAAVWAQPPLRKRTPLPTAASAAPADASTDDGQAAVQLVCHTDKKIRFTKSRAARPTSETPPNPPPPGP